MGLYLRKSISVGPLRFNLSTSGVGVSAGVKGFRVGSGPRGNYVHMGRHGVYYRAALPGGSPPTPIPRQNVADSPADGMQEIDSGDVSQMCDSSSAELLAEFDQKRKKARLAPIVGVIGGVAILAAFGSQAPVWLSLGAIAASVLGFWLALTRDDLAKTVVLFYKLDRDAEDDYQKLHEAFEELRGCCGKWHIGSRGVVTDRKREAGASSLITRESVALSATSPPFVKTNVEIPTLPAGRQTLYFFPDRLLVFDKGSVGAIAYDGLTINRSSTRFIESSALPGDAEVVGRTWKYVNKTGGPDRRFKGNVELPIALYEEMHLTSGSGLNELFQLSRIGAGSAFEGAIQRLAKEPITNGGPVSS